MLDVIKVEIEKQIARLEQLKSQEIAKQRVNVERQFITPKNVELEKEKRLSSISKVLHPMFSN